MELITKTVEAGKMKEIAAAVSEALTAGEQPLDILNCMVEAMGNIGDKFQRNEIFVPEMLVSALTMKKGVEVLKPLLGVDGSGGRGKFIIGTVAGDLHDIGKNLVALMLESAGYEIVDLGVEVPAARFVEAIKAHPDCHLVGVSALLTTTLPTMRDTVQAISEAGLKRQVKVIVGGAPVNQAFADEIGADYYAPDAAVAAQLAKSLTA